MGSWRLWEMLKSWRWTLMNGSRVSLSPEWPLASSTCEDTRRNLPPHKRPSLHHTGILILDIHLRTMRNKFCCAHATESVIFCYSNLYLRGNFLNPNQLHWSQVSASQPNPSEVPEIDHFHEVEEEVSSTGYSSGLLSTVLSKSLYLVNLKPLALVYQWKYYSL